MNIGGKNWDRKLRDEERRLTKLLEELSVKTDLKIDSSGFPVIPTAPTVDDFTQTDPVGFYTEEEDNPLAYSTSLCHQHSSGSSNQQWDKLVVEQLHNDFNHQLEERDNEIFALRQQLHDREQSLLQCLQWKNSVSNHVTLLLHNFHRALASQQNQQVVKQQQQKMVKLHDRILHVITENLDFSPSCAHLIQAPMKLSQESIHMTDVEKRQKLDRFSNYYIDYDMFPRAAAHEGGHHQHFHHPYRSNIRVLHASEEEVCGYTFDLLLRLQATCPDFRDVPDKVLGGNGRDITSSITLRHFLLMLMALDAIGQGCTLHDAVDAFHLVAHRSRSAASAPMTSAGTQSDTVALEGSFAAVALEDTTQWTLRINYLEFVQALEHCANARNRAMLKSKPTDKSLSNSAKDKTGSSNSPNQKNTSSGNNSTPAGGISLQGIQGFIHSWASRLDRFVGDFEFFQRVAAACYPVTHAIVVQILSANERTVLPQAIRHMHYRVVSPHKAPGLSSAQAVGLGTTGFEVFCINHDLVPQLLPSSAVRRIVQHVQVLYPNTSQSSHSVIFVLLLMMAQYFSEVRILDKVSSTTTATGPKSDRAHTQLQQTILLVPILEDFFVRILRNIE